MSEELLQRDLIKNPEKIGKWDFYNIGATTVKALKESNIIRNVNYGAFERKKVDALMVQNKNVIAVIEYKIPKKFKTAKDHSKAIEQEIEVAKKLGAKIFIATDTKEAIWINALTGNRIKDENGKEIKVLFDSRAEKLPELLKKVYDSINEQTDNIKPKEFVNPTNLAKSIWQDIWSVSGATPENCLYTFVELFIFKYLSDLDVLKGVHNFYTLIKMYDGGNTENEVLEHYATTIRPKIKQLFPQDTEDKTTIINGTIFVNKDQKAVKGYSTTFKTVLDKFLKYGKLENIDYDFKSQIFESFLKESISKKNWGQFFTPLKVVRSIVEMAKDDIKEGVSICDPACGVGKFLLEPLTTRLEDFYNIKKDKIVSKIAIHGFDKGFDKDEQKTIILAKANMLIYFSDLIKDNPNLTQEFAKLFNDSFTLKTNSILGTLSEPVENEYNLILTNPPYVTSGSGNLKDEIKKDGELENYYKINAMGVEGLFMEWIVKALKPGGKAFVVIPDGILNRQNDKNLRKFILDECYIDGIISLPIKTFFTTPKKTYILAITKKTNKKDIQKKPVFTYLVSEIGESRDIYRFDIEQNDLQEAVKLFKGFKGSPEYFIENNSDKRCKIQSIDKFNPEQHWSVDRWWSKEEKIELGILEEDKIVGVQEFGELIGDISESLNEFSQLVKEFGEKKKLKNSFKEIFLSDKKYFDLFIGKRLVKKDLVKISGNIPIYSANVFNPVGYHFKSNIENFENDFVIWGIDGDFEFNFIKKNTPFMTTDHCGVIRILTDNILPEYLMLQLSKVKHKYGFDRGLRSSLKNMKDVVVQIPIDSNGDFDLDFQKNILDKYQIIKEVKQKVEEYKKQIKDLMVEIKINDQKTKLIKIDDLFNIKQGNAFYTKKRVIGNGWKGNIPVYSSNTKNEGLLMKMDLDKINKNDLYYQYCLTWSVDGYAGKLFVRNSENLLQEKKEEYFFTINNHCGILIPRKDDLCLEYIKFIIQPLFFDKAKGYGNKKLGTNQIENIKVQIPIDNQENFDLQAQKEIAEKYKKIESIKKAINLELDKIFETNIDL